MYDYDCNDYESMQDIASDYRDSRNPVIYREDTFVEDDRWHRLDVRVFVRD